MFSSRVMLEKFRDHEITHAELQQYLQGDLSDVIAYPVVVKSENIIDLLQSYLNGSASEQTILDWVNTIWFKDYYDYYDPQSNSMASVMTELEMIDEDGHELTPEQARIYVDCLQRNKDLHIDILGYAAPTCTSKK